VLVSVPNPDRPDFNRSPHSFEYPNAPRLAELLGGAGFQAEVLGAFALEEQGAQENRLAPLRHFAVRYRLIPRSMRFKALLKRIVYGRLPGIGEVRDGAVEYRAPVPLGNGPAAGRSYKTLYAVGRLAARSGLM